jgi:hypothetical protein
MLGALLMAAADDCDRQAPVFSAHFGIAGGRRASLTRITPSSATMISGPVLAFCAEIPEFDSPRKAIASFHRWRPSGRSRESNSRAPSLHSVAHPRNRSRCRSNAGGSGYLSSTRSRERSAPTGSLTQEPLERARGARGSGPWAICSEGRFTISPRRPRAIHVIDRADIAALTEATLRFYADGQLVGAPRCDGIAGQTGALPIADSRILLLRFTRWRRRRI